MVEALTALLWVLAGALTVGVAVAFVVFIIVLVKVHDDWKDGKK